MLPKYKLLTTLYLCQRFGALSPSVDFFHHLLGVSYSQTISRLKKESLISLKWSNDKSQMSNLTITYLGTNALLSRYPLLDYFQTPALSSQPVSWDPEPGFRVKPGMTRGQNDGGGDGGKFTLVVFNIPEEKRQIRDRLRYVLKSAGFGQINRSLYISPHLTIKEANHILSSRSHLSVQKGETFERLGFAFSVPFESFKEIDKETLTNFWDLKEVEEFYNDALSLWETGLFSRHAELGSASGSRNKFGMTKTGRFLSKFLDGLGQDPFLPALLLPNNWPGRKALEVAKEILTKKS